MNCDCKWTEVVIALVILIFSFVDWYSKWVIAIAALVLLVHALLCKNCGSCKDKSMKTNKSKK